MKFEAKYFIESEYSNYSDYRQKKFVHLAQELIEFVPILRTQSLLDFGCATGGLIKVLKEQGMTQIKGTDISYWAIDYGKRRFKLSKELDYYNVNLLTDWFDIILFLDVLEHVPSLIEIDKFLRIIRAPVIVVRLPISLKEGDPYVLEVSRNDSTHVQCHTKSWWLKLFKVYGFHYFEPLNGKAIYDSEGVLAGVFRR